MKQPLVIDLFCGLGGWSEGFIDAGWRAVGFDTVRHAYGDLAYPGELVLQDVLTLHGWQFRDADLIVASPPCQKYSWLAMPWSRSTSDKSQAAKALRRKWETEGPDNVLFDACFRIQAEACKAADHHIPMVVENVRGAQEWVGRARWHYGSFYLWGDVPALMPVPGRGHKVPGFRFDGESHGSFQTASVVKVGGDWFRDPACHSRFFSTSDARKIAAAKIAKIPPAISEHFAEVFRPKNSEECILVR